MVQYTCLGAQKNRLIEAVVLSTHNICFGLEIRNYFSVTHSELKSCSELLPTCRSVLKGSGKLNGGGYHIHSLSSPTYLPQCVERIWETKWW